MGNIDLRNKKEVKHWADQTLILLKGFESYLEAVKKSGDMHPPGHPENAYSWAQRFYGVNGTLTWINNGLGQYTTPGWFRRFR
jgi:hypothetical protein